LPDSLSNPLQAQQLTNVDMNLVLAIDCSSSGDSGEYALQMAGMAAAFIDPEIVQAIQDGPHGAISVTVVQWSHPDSQIIVVPWTRIANDADVLALASQIVKTKRQTSEGATSISGMLKFGERLIRSSPFRATRNVIDIVADGENNNGERVEWVRDRVNANGITINGLAILNEVSYLFYYMQNRVIGGNSAFVEQAADYTDFARAIRRKLMREIEGVPIG
jgi:hypothetical protein